MSSNFNFEEQKEQSAIKTEIVTKYFNAWANILAPRYPQIAYIDLFAGPGLYDDGTKSTPIIITETVLRNPKFVNKTLLYFNEMNPTYFDKLKTNILSLDGLNQLTYQPLFHNIEIDYNTPAKFMLQKIPSFCFLDPAGYKGLSLNLIYSFGKDFGTDVIFFFNYNDINRGITNPKVTSEMKQLFGEQRYQSLLSKIENQHGQNRESIVINEMSEAIKDIGINHILPFRFKFIGRNRTSHYLIFASKSPTGFSIMKDIMYKIGEKDYNGIGRFEFIPSCDQSNYEQLTVIDLFNTTFEEFKNNLCTTYQHRRLKVKELIDTDSPNTKFVTSQYKDALKQLEQDGKIQCIPPYHERKRNTLADHVYIVFP